MWFNDRYWQGAAERFLSLRSNYPVFLVPAAFQPLSPRCFPLEFAHIFEPGQCAIMLPKDDVDRLPLAWIRALPSMQPIYANPVFAGFGGEARSDTAPISESEQEDLPYIFDRARRCLLGRQVRNSRIDTSLSDTADGEPYGLVVCASLTHNVGDRVLATGALELLRIARPDLKWVVADPDVDRLLVRKASAVVIGPGGVLYDLAGDDTAYVDFQNIANYFRFGFLAAEYNVLLVMLGIGTQGSVSSTSKRFVAASLATAKALIARDDRSAREIESFGSYKAPALSAPDCSVALQRMVTDAASRQGASQRIVTLCGTFDALGPAWLTSVLDAAAKAGAAFQVVLQAREDAAWYGQVAGRFAEAGLQPSVHDLQDGSAEDFIDAIARSDALLTTRFHGTMVGLMAGVSLVAFGEEEDKRHRVIRNVGERPWRRFLSFTDCSSQEQRSVANDLIASGHRDASRTPFSVSELADVQTALNAAFRQEPL